LFSRVPCRERGLQSRNHLNKSKPEIGFKQNQIWQRTHTEWKQKPATNAQKVLRFHVEGQNAEIQNIKCPKCQMSKMSNVQNVKCPKCPKCPNSTCRKTKCQKIKCWKTKC
jgi:hypothetical protein